jgi:HEAT repeat protein
MPQRPVIDLVSFLLGFVSATIIWWLARALKPLIPRLKTALKHQLEVRRQRKLEGVSRYVRLESLRRAQSNHLARDLFSLDEILIPPRLIAPPDYLLNPPISPEGQKTAEKVIPYLPDWPEFSAPFPVHTLTAAQAMSQGVNIALVGEPGSGRSVTLAHLATTTARREPAAEGLANHVPILLHTLDLDFQAAGVDNDPLDLVRRSLAQMIPVIAAAQLPKYTRELFTNGCVLLLIDGMDELPPPALREACDYLKSLMEKYPKIRIALTASIDLLDGLTALGFFPLTVVAWDASDRNKFIHKWSSQWNKLIAPEIEKRSEAKRPDPLLLTTWLTADPLLQTPMEWTMRAWAAFAGDMQGAGSMNDMLAYILRINHKNVPLEALAELAYTIFCSGLTALPYELVEASFSKYKPDQNLIAEDKPAEERTSDSTPEKKSNPNKQVRISSGAGAANALLDNGLLEESSAGLVRFKHLRIAGYLASLAYQQGQELPSLDRPFSSLQLITLRYLAAQGKINTWIKHTLEKPGAPLHRNLLMAGRWLADAPADLPWRSPVIRMLLQLVQNEQLPVHLRARCLAAVTVSNDTAIPILLKQLLEAESPIARQLAAIACGASQQPKTTMDLIKCLNDPNPQVARAACLSLGSFGTRLAFESMVDLLNTGDEELQIAAAETLAMIPQGAEILRQAASSDQLLIRRAAIAGLSQLRVEWNEELLEKISLEDAQWIIRNAASEALATIQSPVMKIPRPLPQPDQAGWLIQYAGQHGKGIIPGEPVTDYLLSALQNGTVEERLQALQYLRSLPDQPIILAVEAALNDSTELVQEAAYDTLWLLSSCRRELSEQFSV